MAMIAALGAGLVLISAGAIMFWFYSTREFAGDGTISDTGFWSHPRYHIQFPPISLNQSGEHSFSCHGLPPYPLTFKLRIVGKGRYQQLHAGKTSVKLQWLDETGKTICEADGPLNGWTLAWMPSEETGYYWHRNLRDIKVRRGRQYKFKLIIKDVDADSPLLSVEPMLTGGGNELL